VVSCWRSQDHRKVCGAPEEASVQDRQRGVAHCLCAGSFTQAPAQAVSLRKEGCDTATRPSAVDTSHGFRLAPLLGIHKGMLVIKRELLGSSCHSPFECATEAITGESSGEREWSRAGATARSQFCTQVARQLLGCRCRQRHREEEAHRKTCFGVRTSWTSGKRGRFFLVQCSGGLPQFVVKARARKYALALSFVLRPSSIARC